MLSPWKIWVSASSVLVLVVALPDIKELTGTADFKFVTLHWKYDRFVPDLYAFRVKYCEVQAWGSHRCRTKVMDDPSGNEVPSAGFSRYKQYSVRLNDLRMATNYTFQVTPVLADQQGKVRGQDRTIAVQTKGFSAQATACLADFTEVAVETGPNFGGKISVEDSADPDCAVQGNPQSAQTSYTLAIAHERCGSHVNSTSVTTFILVQENLPILTHSTRRFLVVCSFTSETFTVRAGVSLPSDTENNVEAPLEPVGKSVVEVIVDPSELNPHNNVIDSRAQHQRQAAQVSDVKPRVEKTMAHLVLMVILVIAAVIGTAVAIWWFVATSRRLSTRGHMDPQEEPYVLRFSSMENIVRDYSREETPPSTPSVALVGIRQLDEKCDANDFPSLDFDSSGLDSMTQFCIDRISTAEAINSVCLSAELETQSEA